MTPVSLYVPSYPQVFDLATDDSYQVADIWRVPKIQVGGSGAGGGIYAASCTVHLSHEL